MRYSLASKLLLSLQLHTIKSLPASGASDFTANKESENAADEQRQCSTSIPGLF